MTGKDELLLALMEQVASGGDTALVDQVVRSWQNIARRFSPLIGASSVLLLFERSIESNRAHFAWLPVLPFPAQPETAFDHLHAGMAGLPHATVLTAHRALLATFIDLMTALIGARLTIQFLRAALPAASASSNPEENA
jgi:hypothetical protein